MELFGAGLMLGIVIGGLVERFVVVPLARELARHDRT